MKPLEYYLELPSLIISVARDSVYNGYIQNVFKMYTETNKKSIELSTRNKNIRPLIANFKKRICPGDDNIKVTIHPKISVNSDKSFDIFVIITGDLNPIEVIYILNRNAKCVSIPAGKIKNWIDNVMIRVHTNSDGLVMIGEAVSICPFNKPEPYMPNANNDHEPGYTTELLKKHLGISNTRTRNFIWCLGNINESVENDEISGINIVTTMVDILRQVNFGSAYNSNVSKFHERHFVEENNEEVKTEEETEE